MKILKTNLIKIKIIRKMIPVTKSNEKTNVNV